MNIEPDESMNVMQRKTAYKPPRSFSTWLIGRPLSTADAPHQTIGKFIGLAVFSSDAMSSVAYGPQEMLIILAAAGAGAFGYSIPIAIAICVLLLLLTLSYEQTIHAYSGGGGAYIVARDNLGEIPALTAGAALLMDYILTVAVSISSGVAQLVSAFPLFYDYRVWIAVGMVLLIMIINMRGVRESGITFAIPTYFFLIMMFITVIIGFGRYFSGSLGLVQSPPMDIMDLHATLQPITIFLVLKAFASGTTALTGVEAISNGITAFKEPRSKNAGKTLIMMAIILGSLLFSIAFLSNHIGALPSEEETVISQLTRTALDTRGIFYILVLSSTTIILMMAANTAFADYPRLSALMAIDGFLPRQLAYRGSRLVYSRGIMLLAGIASLLIILFRASVTRLIPLYAIGVFLSFTLSQTGMAHRWWKSGRLEPGDQIKERGSVLYHDRQWLLKMLINGLGAMVTLVVAIIFGVTKFTDGAYIVVFLIPFLAFVFYSIHRHYQKLAGKLSLENFGMPPHIGRHRIIIPIGGVHRGTLAALRYARMISDDITAVHVSIDQEETEKIRQKWDMWGGGVRLLILESPYRLFVEPLLEYIDEIDSQRKPNELITIVVPQFVTRRISSNALHSRTANTLRNVLLNRPGIVITEVPYLVE